MVDPKTIDHQLQPLLPNEIIRASAGTGKTFALSNRYLVLLASGVDCQSILATTFTKKGAGEILDRIVQRLSAAALSDRAAEELTAQLDFKISRQHAAGVLHQLLKNLHRLEISTLDSFFQRVAKAFSLELGLPPIWDLVEEQQIQMLREEAVQSVLRSEELQTLRHLMDKGESNRRIQSLLMDTVVDLYSDFRDSRWDAWDQLEQPDRWLTSNEMEKLVLESGQREYRVRQKNWDALHQLIVDENWIAISQHTAVQNVLDGQAKYYASPIPDEALAMLKQLISHCRSWIIERLRLRNLSTRQLLAAFGLEFESAKDRLGQLFFDDIADRLKNFVQDCATEQFSFRLDHQIQHLMLDEFQDTSPTQWSILSPFAQQVTRDGEPGRSFFCVGDMKQAIFGWRGGVAEIFNVVQQQLPNLQPAQPMVKSYRSSPVIIDFVNDLFGNLNRFVSDDDEINDSVRSWSEWFLPHQTQRSDYPGRVTIQYADDCDASSAKSHRSIKDSIRNENVVHAVVEKVTTLVQALPANATIGVLTRTNQDVGKIIFALQNAGVPASEEGGNPLTDSAAVGLILSAFQLADHPGDDVARYHVSHSDLASMFDLNPESDSNRGENLKAVAAGAASVRRKILQQGVGPTVEAMANLLTEACTRRERVRLQSLVEMAYADPQDQQRWSLRPRRFVEYVNEKKVSDATSAPVRVMTIHRSKGLEFDAVVMPIFKTQNGGLSGRPAKIILDRENPADPANRVTRYVGQKEQKFLPPEFQEAFRNDDRRKIRESMCLLYVAVTRAAHALHIIASCGEKPKNKTVGGVVLATMSEVEEPTPGIVYQAGDELWFENPMFTKSQETDDDADAQADAEKLQQSLRRFYRPAAKAKAKTKAKAKAHNSVRPGIQSRRGVQTVTPSSPEAGDGVSLRKLLGAESQSDATAMERGSLLHGCFECVQWLDQAVPSEDQLDQHLEKVAAGSVLKRKAIRDFFKAIETKSLANLLNFESYQKQYLLNFGDASNRMEVFTERRFAATVQQAQRTELIQGVVDRLVLIYQNDRLVAADVIDFKSDAIKPEELSDKVALYRSQLSVYRQALSVSLGLPVASIATRLAFISTGDVVNLDFIETTVDATTKLKSPAPQTPPKAQPPRHKRVVDQIGSQGDREKDRKRIVDQRTDNGGAKKSQPAEDLQGNAGVKAKATLWPAQSPIEDSPIEDSSIESLPIEESSISAPSPATPPTEKTTQSKAAKPKTKPRKATKATKANKANKKKTLDSPDQKKLWDE